ncbi:MAG: L-threonylcarbamoyladenylate synthase [Leptospirillum sp.]|nr:Sua5/YciO/YrdC/YwlC family protein [Nitrospiraceae bacterium]MDA8150856.1 Sua5/YciO/YrdC/YwlC family protein [Nitrospiraceae bacterium]
MSIPVFPPLSERSGWGRIREAIHGGGVLALPLEYSWCMAQSPLAVSRNGQTPARSSLHQIKRRPSAKPFLYMAGSLSGIRPFAFLPSSVSSHVWIDAWPAFLTLILPAKPLAVSLGMSRFGGVAFRIPGDPLLRSFLSFLKTPVTGTSLNISGSPPLVSMQEIQDVFPELDGIVFSNEKDASRISPVIDLSKGMPHVVRPGQGLFPICDLRYKKM